MKDPLTIDVEELESLQKLKDAIQKNIFDFGVLYMEKIELDNLRKSLNEKEDLLITNDINFKKQESELMNKILQKYGEGSLNISNGVFTPS